MKRTQGGTAGTGAAEGDEVGAQFLAYLAPPARYGPQMWTILRLLTARGEDGAVVPLTPGEEVIFQSLQRALDKLHRERGALVTMPEALTAVDDAIQRYTARQIRAM